MKQSHTPSQSTTHSFQDTFYNMHFNYAQENPECHYIFLENDQVEKIIKHTFAQYKI